MLWDTGSLSCCTLGHRGLGCPCQSAIPPVPPGSLAEFVLVAAPQTVAQLGLPPCSTSCSPCPLASLPGGTWCTSPRALPSAVALSSRCCSRSLAAPLPSAPSGAVASSPPCARCGSLAPTASRCRHWAGSGHPAPSSSSSLSRPTPTDTAEGQEGPQGHFSSCPSPSHQWGQLAQAELILHCSFALWTPPCPLEEPLCCLHQGQTLTQQVPGGVTVSCQPLAIRLCHKPQSAPAGSGANSSGWPWPRPAPRQGWRGMAASGVQDVTLGPRRAQGPLPLSVYERETASCAQPAGVPGTGIYFWVCPK